MNRNGLKKIRSLSFAGEGSAEVIGPHDLAYRLPAGY